MIGVLMTFPRQPETGLFEKFVKNTPGVVKAYLLKGDGGNDATFTVWESVAAREAYLKSEHRKEVDASLPGLSRTVFEVVKTS